MHVPGPLLEAFARQADWCHAKAPFTARVLLRTRAWLEDDAEARTNFAEAAGSAAGDPLAAAVPLRWAAALHHLALRGAQPWAALWPPAVGHVQATDAELDLALHAAWRSERAHVKAALARAPQTNEVQRSAALLPGMLGVAGATGLPVNLLEIGASAGLNLWCERYHVDYGSWQRGSAAAAVHLQCRWAGAVPQHAAAALQVSRRAACDAHPVDLRQPDEALRLAGFIWADEAERLARCRAAQRAATQWLAQDQVVVEALPAARFVERELALPRTGAVTVLMHSVVWQYLGPAEQAAITHAVQAAAQRATPAAPLAWLRFEPPTPTQPVELRCTLWPGGQDRLLARAHPHAQHIEWLA